MGIAIENLTKRYGRKSVLRNLNLHIESGACYCLLGKNGAGKTTLLNCVLDLVLPDEGNVQLMGKNYREHGLELKAITGAMCEDNPLVEELSGLNYLRFVGRLYKIPAAEAEERIRSLAGYFFGDLQELHKSIGGYSTGMKKKLGMCAALLHKPQVLVLDEPFTGLDPMAAQLLVELLQNYRRHDRIILISSHDLNYVEKVATQIGVLDDGEMKYSGTLSDFTMNGEGLLDQALFRLLQPNQAPAQQMDWMLN